MKWNWNGKIFDCIQDDISAQSDIDVVVNAANAELVTGGGVAGALHRKAGPELAEACAPHAPLEPGEVVMTEAFGLPNKHVIHCLGPIYGLNNPSDELLAKCYRDSLRLAEEKGLESIAFPAISTGTFGYPQHEAIKVAIPTVLGELENLNNLKHVRFVLFGSRDLGDYEDFLTDELGSSSD
ncbi:RNase III inhibitor [Halalkalibacillus sediminis]|uniref:RNase III inhibitor n=1 Tax=Halalkalibacillus sediminis TaxID=2018042 RepID=A0A2I0QSG6_9BACI|nr:macro domain-containing protein [Halalkalibacillus sediminis]PKR77295.1 RNase III inhibitor [Halalkalibacillus sediminis]